jgi:hypothetical protein
MSVVPVLMTEPELGSELFAKIVATGTGTADQKRGRDLFGQTAAQRRHDHGSGVRVGAPPPLAAAVG